MARCAPKRALASLTLATRSSRLCIRLAKLAKVNNKKANNRSGVASHSVEIQSDLAIVACDASHIYNTCRQFRETDESLQVADIVLAGTRRNLGSRRGSEARLECARSRLHEAHVAWA